MSRRLMAFLAVAVVLTTGCSFSDSAANGSRRWVYRFTCCTEGDINRVYHPGEVVVVHWIVEPRLAVAPASPTPITLSAALDGGFLSAVAAKSGQAGSDGQIHAKAVYVTDQTTTEPISRLRIPADWTPGLYNLTTGKADSGGRLYSTSTIRVE